MDESPIKRHVTFAIDLEDDLLQQILSKDYSQIPSIQENGIIDPTKIDILLKNTSEISAND